MNKNKVRWITVFVSLFAGSIGGGIVTAWTSPTVTTFQEVVATRLTIVDNAGRPTVVVGVASESAENALSIRGYITIRNTDGKGVVLLHSDRSGGVLVVTDENGKAVDAFPMAER